MLCTSFRWVVPTFWTHVSWRRIGSWRFGLFCPSLHWSQILRFVTNAGSGSRILRLRRNIPLLFGEKSFETVCLDSFISRFQVTGNANREDSLANNHQTKKQLLQRVHLNNRMRICDAIKG